MADTNTTGSGQAGRGGESWSAPMPNFGNSSAAGAGIFGNPTPPPGTQIANAGVQGANAGAAATKPAPAVVTSSAAIQDVNNIKNTMNGVTQGMTDQNTKNQSTQSTPPPAQTPTGGPVIGKDFWGRDLYTNVAAGNNGNITSTTTPSVTTSSQTNTNDQTSHVPTDTTPQQNSQPDQYTQQLNDLNGKTDQAYNTFQNSINQMQSGTFPLSPDQQAQVNALQAQFAQMRTAQFQANQNFQNGTNQIELASGRSRYAPNIAQGNLANAVNVGIQKINDLDSRAAGEVSKLRDGFQSKNFDLVKQSYDAFNGYMKDKTATIMSLKKSVDDHEKDLRDYNYRVTQDNLTNKINSDKFDYQQKKDAFDEAMSSAQFSESQKKDLADQFYKQQDLDLRQQAQEQKNTGLGIPPGMPPISMTATGKPNPVDQAKFLASLPPQIASIVKSLANYTELPSNLSTRGDNRANMIALAQQYDPTYDPSSVAQRQSFMKNWDSGQLMTTRLALNTTMGHLGELKTAADALGNLNMDKGWFGTEKYNSLKQMLDKNSGNPSVSNFNTAMNAVAGELSKVYGNSTQGEVESFRNQLNSAATPEQIKGFVNTAMNLLNSKIGAMRDQYSQTMGKPMDKSIFGDNAIQSIKALRAQGLDIDPSKIDPGNEWRYQSLKEFGASNPNQQQAILKMKSGPDKLSDSDIMQILNQGKDSGSGFSPDTSTSLKGSFSQIAPDGSTGGQCGHFVHNLVDGIPAMGDSLNDKENSLKKYGQSANEWRQNPQVGDVIITNESKENGHVAVINSINPDGTVTLSESNYNLNEKVNNNRKMPLNSPRILGAFRGTPKTNFA